MGGINGVNLAIVLQYLPQHIYCRPQSAAEVTVLMHYHVDAMLPQMGGTIQKMSGKLSLFPFSIYILGIFGMIKIYSHNCKYTAFFLTDIHNNRKKQLIHQQGSLSLDRLPTRHIKI